MRKFCKKEIQKEALFFEIDLKNKNGKEKTINQLENEIYDKINSMKPDSDDEEEREEDEDLFYQKKTCMRNSKKNIEKEAKKFDVDILDKKKKQKTKDSLCREISNKKESVINEIIRSSKKLNLSIPELPSRQKSFLKGQCMENLKCNIEQEAERFKIDLKRANKTKKTKEELCKEIELQKNLITKAIVSIPDSSLKNCKTKKETKNKKKINYCCNDYNEAAENEHMDCLKYLFQKGYDMEEEYVCYIAVEKNNFEMLKFAVANGFDVSDEAITAKATEDGNLEMLKYLHQNGCPISLYTVRDAAAWGRLDCLKYLHKNDCDWDSVAPLLAAENGNLDCFKYLYENKCPIDLEECLDYATIEKKTTIINYINNLNSCKTKKNKKR